MRPKKPPLPKARYGVRDNHPVALALRELGVSTRDARRIVGIVFERIAEALELHDSVETPIGTFRVVKEPRRRQLRPALGRFVWSYRNRYRIVLDTGE
jgi:nucleoid DNA-binding protein